MKYRVCPNCKAKIWEPELVRCPDCDAELEGVKK